MKPVIAFFKICRLPALFGGLHPIGAVPASVFFGGLLVGAQKLQRTVQVSSSLITVINGLVVIFVVSSQIFIKRRAKRRVAEARESNAQTEQGTPSA